VLSLFVILMIIVSRVWLPAGHPPDATVKLRLGPVLQNYATVLREPQFLTYALAGAFAFSGLLVYVASSPVIFLEVFHVSTQMFGAIFAGMSVAFIGSNQVNVLLLRKFTSEQIFRGALLVQCPAVVVLLVGSAGGWFNVPVTLAVLFVSLASLGLTCPNSAALALLPFDHNIGSAAAMLGFLQIGISGLASASIGIFNSHSLVPLAIIMTVTSFIGLGILLIGRRFIPQVRYVEETGVTPLHY